MKICLQNEVYCMQSWTNPETFRNNFDNHITPSALLSKMEMARNFSGVQYRRKGTKFDLQPLTLVKLLPPYPQHWPQGENTSVQFRHSVMSDSFRPHGPQHTRLPCPLPTPRACSDSCPSSQWCHPTISSSVIPFSSCLPSFPAWRSFLRSQFFAPGSQSIGASTSASACQWIFRTDFL